ncbi:MAG: glycosyltransferase [Erysipelotrichaceae bacterium]|nr:glycosyltransferase [Erysipelotrichaceae bacterium]MDY3933963.1 glycosyltransferase family 2 protein [Bacilli bacterium]
MEFLYNLIDSIISFIGGLYPVSKNIYNILGVFLSVIVIHKAFYFVIGMFFTRKFKPAKKQYKYAIMIAARNEKYVIGNLIDSINKQDYPKDKITIFVVADNCDDNTAEIARSKGAICYERFDPDHRTKGYALEFLVDRIKENYGIESFDGYFIFDADNLLKRNYITKMNDAFDSGEKIITSYRNTKNFDENWIASTYALHWIRSIRTNHRARSVLRLATNIQGTGFLFHNEIIRDGWHYTSLTEDRALTADAVAQGYRISYQDEAEFFDEQPINLKVALRQRLRWSKGHLQAFAESGPYLFANIFLGKRYLKTKWNKDIGRKKKNRSFKEFMLDILESIRHRFASFDTLVQLTPIAFINLCRWLLISVFIYSCYTYMYGISDMEFFGGSVWLAKLLRNWFHINININAGFMALVVGFFISIWYRLLYRIGNYFRNIWLAVYLFIIEDARIKKISFWKKVLYVFTWPIFDIIGRYTIYAALFMNVTWKPIPHESKVTIDDLSGGSK